MSPFGGEGVIPAMLDPAELARHLVEESDLSGRDTACQFFMRRAFSSSEVPWSASPYQSAKKCAKQEH